MNRTRASETLANPLWVKDWGKIPLSLEKQIMMS